MHAVDKGRLTGLLATVKSWHRQAMASGCGVAAETDDAIGRVQLNVADDGFGQIEFQTAAEGTVVEDRHAPRIRSALS